MEDPSHETQDDFEESLVRAVIEENPPEEQGVRDEWQKQTGWHRKEDIHLRRRNKHQEIGKRVGDIINVEGSLIRNGVDGHRASPTHDNWNIFWILMIMVGAISGCALIVYGSRFRRTKVFRARKTMEDVV